MKTLSFKYSEHTQEERNNLSIMEKARRENITNEELNTLVDNTRNIFEILKVMNQEGKVMTIEEKAEFLYGVFLIRNCPSPSLIQPNTHLALCRIERIEKAFLFYGPEWNWFGRAEEFENLYDDFLTAMTYTNEFNKTGFEFLYL
jgi:hypothetical protein